MVSSILRRLPPSCYRRPDRLLRRWTSRFHPLKLNRCRGNAAARALIELPSTRPDPKIGDVKFNDILHRRTKRRGHRRENERPISVRGRAAKLLWSDRDWLGICGNVHPKNRPFPSSYGQLSDRIAQSFRSRYISKCTGLHSTVIFALLRRHSFSIAHRSLAVVGGMERLEKNLGKVGSSA